MKASLLAHAAPALLLSALLIGGVSAPSLAQSAPTATPATASPSGSTSTTSAPRATAPSATTQRRASSSPSQGQNMQQLVERRITELHSKLHITAQQQPQWMQFAQVMRDNATDIDNAYRQRAEKLNSMNAVDNMQSYAQIEQTRTQDIQKLVPAFQTLYTSLSDTQKKEADALFRNYAASSQRKQASAR